MKRVLFLFIIIFFLSGCGQTTDMVSISVESEDFVTEKALALSQESDANIQILENKKTTKINEIVDAIEPNKIIKVPNKFELLVDFAPQAPFANWDNIHEEACEEASMIMVDKYFKNQQLSEVIMEEELQKLLKWQKERGYKVDLTTNEVVEILKDYFNLGAKLSTEVTVDKIKYELFNGNLIIVPTAGRELKNPNFKQPGPIYHMLVIKGYNDKEFITNDPGTKRGNNYKYLHQRLLDAIHDWDHKLAEDGMTEVEITHGRQIMIIVKKI